MRFKISLAKPVLDPSGACDNHPQMGGCAFLAASFTKGITVAGAPILSLSSAGIVPKTAHTFANAEKYGPLFFLLNRRFQGFDLVGLFPGNAEVFPSDVAIGGELAVDGTAQLEVADYRGGAQVKHLFNRTFNCLVVVASGTKSIHHDRHRMGDADGVGELNLTFGGKSSGNHVFRDVTRGISRAAVNLGRILARKGAAAMARIAAIGIDNDLSASQAAVTLWAADDKPTGRIDEIPGFPVQKFCGNHRLDHLFDDVLPNLFESHFVAVLG